MITIYQGTNQTVRRTVKLLSGGLADLSSSPTIAFTVRKTIAGAALIEKSTALATQIDITDVANSQFELYLLPADTTLLESGEYFYDYRLTLSNGKKYNYSSGKFLILDSITRDA